MLTRRWFAGCAVCAVMEAIATGADAQTAAAPPTSGFTRRIISRVDGPSSPLVTVQGEGIAEAGFVVARHTHPGIESTFCAEGGGTLQVAGAADRVLTPGDSFVIPLAVPHGFVTGPQRTRLLSTWTVDGTQPMSTLVPA